MLMEIACTINLRSPISLQLYRAHCTGRNIVNEIISDVTSRRNGCAVRLQKASNACKVVMRLIVGTWLLHEHKLQWKRNAAQSVSINQVFYSKNAHNTCNRMQQNGNEVTTIRLGQLLIFSRNFSQTTSSSVLFFLELETNKAEKNMSQHIFAFYWCL